MFRTLARARAGRAVAGALLAGMLVLPAAAQYTPPPTTLPPVDEGAKDMSWQTFKARMQEAVQARDRKALLGMIAGDVDNGVQGVPRSVEAFRTLWDWNDDASPLWQELGKALSLGTAYLKSARDPGRLCAPYVAIRWPSEVNPFTYGALTAREVLVKARPSAASDTVARLAFDVVEVADWEVADESKGSTQKWTQVKRGKEAGYIPVEVIRSPLENLACFAKREGRWQLISLTRGDLPD